MWYSNYFNKLVEEKIIIREAARRGVIPTEKEVSVYLDEQKKQYAEDDPSQRNPKDPTLRYYADMVMKEWSLTWDEYWNVYERYNAIRLLSLCKLVDSIMAKAQAAGKVQPLNPSSDQAMQIQEQRKNYLGQYLLDLKRKAEVKLNPQFQSLNLSVDRDRFYLIHYPS